MGRDGGFSDFGYLDTYRPQAPHQLFGAQGGSLCPTALGSNAPGPPGYDRYGQFDSSFIYQQARRDPFPHLATFDSRTSPLDRGSEHYSPSTTYSRLPERDSRPPISSKSANIDKVVPSPRNRETYLQGFVGHQKSTCLHQCPTHTFLSSCLQFWRHEPYRWMLCLRTGRGGQCTCFLHSLLIKVIQKLRSTQAAEVILVVPWWPKQSGFSTPTSSLCGSPLCAFPSIEIFCPSRIRSMSWTESRTICTHGGSHATL